MFSKYNIEIYVYENLRFDEISSSKRMILNNILFFMHSDKINEICEEKRYIRENGKVIVVYHQQRQNHSLPVNIRRIRKSIIT